MKAQPSRWIMSLNYKDQHETSRTMNQTHNPKVEGSNPSPATKPLNKGSTGLYGAGLYGLYALRGQRWSQEQLTI
jgi:hypothetical protein